MTTNVADWRRRASRRLPQPILQYLEGGADDERTMRRNEEAFADYELWPRPLVDIGQIVTRTRLLGCELSLPVMLSATGMTRLFHHERELGVARAAAAAGLLYSLSTLATTSLEDVAAIGGPRLFQLYIFRDRELTRELVRRCVAAGYHALAVTVDTPLAGNRERDRRTGMTIPPRLGFRSWLSFVAHPSWSLRYLANPHFVLQNVVGRVDALRAGATSIMEYVNGQFDRTVTWSDLEWLRGEWQGPLAVKGLLHPDDVRRAQALGADAVILSNHGGRQLDTAPAAIDCVAAARAAVGESFELIVEGGIRRGTDVIKALALGATAVSIGRPYLYGLAAGGQAGVAAVLGLFREEITRDLALLGRPASSSVNRDCVRHRSSPASRGSIYAK